MNACVICGHEADRMWPRKNAKGRAEYVCNGMCSSTGAIAVRMHKANPSTSAAEYARDMRAQYFAKNPLKLSMWRRR